MMTSYAAVISLGVYAEAAKALGTISNSQMKPMSIQNCPNLNESLQEYQFRDFRNKIEGNLSSKK